MITFRFDSVPSATNAICGQWMSDCYIPLVHTRRVYCGSVYHSRWTKLTALEKENLALVLERDFDILTMFGSLPHSMVEWSNSSAQLASQCVGSADWPRHGSGRLLVLDKRHPHKCAESHELLLMRSKKQTVLVTGKTIYILRKNEYIPPCLFSSRTSLAQPMDASVNKHFKGKMKELWMEW